MTGRAVGLLAVIVLICAGCGVRPQQHPEKVPLSPSTAVVTPSPADPEQATVSVYFIRGERLEPVHRGVPDGSASALLQALTEGPTREEVLRSTRTAIPPQRFRVAISDTSANVAVLQVGEGFASISGENQLLAVAQVVWTLTELPGVERARLELKGEPLEVPTDRGLVGYPVGRSDFDSVRPVGAAEPD